MAGLAGWAWLVAGLAGWAWLGGGAGRSDGDGCLGQGRDFVSFPVMALKLEWRARLDKLIRPVDPPRDATVRGHSVGLHSGYG